MRTEIAGERRAFYEKCSAVELLATVTSDPDFGRIALLSSFGADSAALLHMISEVAPRTPVLMVNTGKLFGETLRYAELLADRFGLADVRAITPQPERVKAADPRGLLWRDDPERCCDLRKVRPLNDALVDFDTTISGRKRYQTAHRKGMDKVELVDGQLKVNPLADWSAEQVTHYAARLDLPPHPLVADGFLSIGCYTCTDRVQPGEDPRAGRWRGHGKTECGIHVPAPARLPHS